MKKCTYCGKEYSEEIANCIIDGEPVKTVSASGGLLPDPPRPPRPPKLPPQKSANGRYLSYDDVPWYRREPGVLAFIGVLFCGLVTISLCIICLTGDVYKKAYDEKGNLQVWGIGNKIAAVLILFLQVFIYWVYRQMNHK
jgi:hypothetical protein